MSVLRCQGLLMASVLIALMDYPGMVHSMAISSAAQYLPPIPGYIPVFIRQGNTPLEDINADLAEAFRAYATKHANFNAISGRSKNVLENKSLKDEEDSSTFIQKISAKKAKQTQN